MTQKTAATEPEGYRPELDGLRAIAIALVVLYHLTIGDVFRGGGQVGIYVFFALSGYLITGRLLAERRRSGRIALGAFYGRRLRRLVPALAAMVGIVSVVAIVLGKGPETLAGAGYAILYVANTVNDGEVLGPFRHTWTLATEEQFYLVWPVLLIVGLRNRWTMIAVAILSAVLVWRLPAFWPIALGCVAAFMFDRWRPSWLAASIAALGVIAWATLNGSDDFPVLLAVSLAAVVLVVDTSPITRALSAPSLVTLGRASYGVYVWHYPVIVAGYWLAREQGIPPAYAAPFLAVAAIVAGVLSYQLVERRFIRTPSTTSHEEHTTDAVLARAGGQGIAVAIGEPTARRVELIRPGGIVVQGERGRRS